MGVTKVPAHHSDYLKYSAEGVKTIGELIDALKHQVSFFEDLAKQDARLTDPVDNGHVFFSIPGHDVEYDDEDEDEDLTCTKCYSS